MRQLIGIFLSVIIGMNTYAQVNVTVNTNDASAFLESYFSPIGKSFGAGLNNGWYNTAKPHKVLGFDFTITLNTVTIPTDGLTFNPNDLQNFSSISGNNPTILGNGDGDIISYDNPNDDIGEIEFSMPKQPMNYWLNLKNLTPVPMANAGIGIGKKTELNFRYFPVTNVDIGSSSSGSINLWGAGIKHDLLQWVPAVGDMIPMSLSLQAAYTSLNSNFGISDPTTTLNQEVNLDVKASTINIIASKKILFITAHAGLGYNSSNTTFNSNTSINLGEGEEALTFEVPLDLKFKTENEFRTNIGVKLNLTIITLQLNHTFSKYPVTTLGLGLSIR